MHPFTFLAHVENVLGIDCISPFGAVPDGAFRKTLMCYSYYSDPPGKLIPDCQFWLSYQDRSGGTVISGFGLQFQFSSTEVNYMKINIK
jgi:hypothetical protein